MSHYDLNSFPKNSIVSYQPIPYAQMKYETKISVEQVVANDRVKRMYKKIAENIEN